MESEEQRDRRLGLRGHNMPLLYLTAFVPSALIIGFFVWLVLQDPNIGTYPIQKWINQGIFMFIAGPLIGYTLIRHAAEEDHKYDPFGYSFPAMPPALKALAVIWFILSIIGLFYFKAQS